MTFDPERWLASLPYAGADGRRYARALALLADERGTFTASTGYLRRGVGRSCGMNVQRADQALSLLRAHHAMEVLTAGDAATQTATVWRLIYSAGPVITGHRTKETTHGHTR